MELGASYEVSRKVSAELCADAVGSGGLPVFGTPSLLALMEHAAYTLLQRELPEGQSSVGVFASLSHSAPTPPGMTVTARAELVRVSENGREFEFQVTAWDEAGPIGAGTHRRAVIRPERFLEKCRQRKGEDGA